MAHELVLQISPLRDNGNHQNLRTRGTGPMIYTFSLNREELETSPNCHEGGMNLELFLDFCILWPS